LQSCTSWQARKPRPIFHAEAAATPWFGRIDSAFSGESVRGEQVEPLGTVERRSMPHAARCGGQLGIISVMFTVPIHGAALYHHCPNSR
jgi:hypothetical protein